MERIGLIVNGVTDNEVIKPDKPYEEWTQDYEIRDVSKPKNSTFIQLCSGQFCNTTTDLLFIPGCANILIVL